MRFCVFGPVALCFATYVVCSCASAVFLMPISVSIAPAGACGFPATFSLLACSSPSAVPLPMADYAFLTPAEDVVEVLEGVVAPGVGGLVPLLAVVPPLSPPSSVCHHCRPGPSWARRRSCRSVYYSNRHVLVGPYYGPSIAWVTRFPPVLSGQNALLPLFS